MTSDLPGQLARISPRMPPPPPAKSPSLTPGDIYYILFRHKWKILICTLIGLVGSVAAHKFMAPPFISQAKLFIRYVIADNQKMPPGFEGLTPFSKSPDRGGETIMASEVEILTSFDLAKQVAEAVGPAKLVSNKKDGAAATTTTPADARDLNLAASSVYKGLKVNVTPRSSIIQLEFSHPNAAVVQPVLNSIVEQYLKKHGEVHRSKGLGEDFLISETDQLRARLVSTDEDLRKVRNKAGVISVEDAKRSLGDQMAQLRQQLFASQALLEERRVMFEEYNKAIAQAKATAPTVADMKPPAEEPIPADKVEEYRLIQSRLATLRRNEQELLLQFQPGNNRVQDVHARVEEADAAKKKLEQQYPRLIAAASGTTTSVVGVPTYVIPGNPREVQVTAGELNALQAKIKVLTSQLASLKDEAAKIDQVESEITQLKRRKDLDDANYRVFASRLEQTRIAEAMGSGGVSNIIPIQTASPPSPDTKTIDKIVGGVAAAGLILGLGWALAVELWIDRSLRRPIDIERLLRLPLLLAIPRLQKKRREKAAKLQGEGAPAAPLTSEELLQPFHETLRDRLIGVFESRDITRKPKLIAVTGMEKGSGVTTTATGLARSLSETGEGNVLLVDMTHGQGSSQQFLHGKPVCNIDELLEGRDNAMIDNNLFVVVENSHRDGLTRNMPQRFAKLIPKLKASDFDYIIFDMPTVSQISITPRLAGLMDIVLLVVESEKTDRDLTQKAASLIAQSKVEIGVVLNKARSYIPQRLRGEFLPIS